MARFGKGDPGQSCEPVREFVRSLQPADALSQVGADDRGVGAQLLGRTLERQGAAFDHVGVGRDGQGLAGVLLDEQDGLALFAQIADELED